MHTGTVLSITIEDSKSNSQFARLKMPAETDNQSSTSEFLMKRKERHGFFHSQSASFRKKENKRNPSNCFP